MENMIPLRKQSKKEQRDFHSRQRGSWGTVKPVSRVEKSGKAYDRRRERKCASQALRSL